MNDRPQIMRDGEPVLPTGWSMDDDFSLGWGWGKKMTMTGSIIGPGGIEINFVIPVNHTYRKPITRRNAIDLVREELEASGFAEFLASRTE